jgi:hypothetical protein
VPSCPFGSKDGSAGDSASGPSGGTFTEGTGDGGRLEPERAGILATPIEGGPPTAVASEFPSEAAVTVSITPAAHSWTSSIRVPKAPLGCTKATVVPRDPGRGTWSMTSPPWSLTDWRAAAQSSTR